MGDAGGTPESTCNARMFDMPFGLFNWEADKFKGRNLFKILNPNPAKRGLPMTTKLSESVWGMAVHGKTGTWAFDSHGPHAGDYLYKIPQGTAMPDYYICDSRNTLLRPRPQSCALLG